MHVCTRVLTHSSHATVQHLCISLFLIHSDFSLFGRNLLVRGASRAEITLCHDKYTLVHIDETDPQDQFATEGRSHSHLTRHLFLRRRYRVLGRQSLGTSGIVMCQAQLGLKPWAWAGLQRAQAC